MPMEGHELHKKSALYALRDNCQLSVWMKIKQNLRKNFQIQKHLFAHTAVISI